MQSAAACQPDFHLIDHDLNAVAPAPLLYGTQESRWRNDQAAIGHERLDENGRYLMGRTGRRELEIQQRQYIIRTEGGMVGIGVGKQYQAGTRQRVRHRGVAADAHRSG